MFPFLKKSKILICATLLHAISAFIIDPKSLQSLRLTRQQGFEFLQRAANDSRGLAFDIVGAGDTRSGHLGFSLGCAEIGAMLWGKYLNMNPQDPHWINRDRFVLSAGYGSTFLYSWLHMAGYDLTLEDLQQFCETGSKTPRQTEWGITPGVEASTGLPGQGFANGVGMACAQKSAQALFNTREHKIFDAHVFVLCDDNCIQDRATSEAAPLAAHYGLDNLIVLYSTSIPSKNISVRFDSYGWEVVYIKGHSLGQLDEILTYAKISKNKRPKLYICATNVQEIPEVKMRENFGLFHVSNETRYFFQRRSLFASLRYEKWQKLYLEWKIKNPEKAFLLEQTLYKEEISAKEWLNHIPDMVEVPTSTRDTCNIIIQEIAELTPLFLLGIGNLDSSCNIEQGGNFDRNNYMGRNLFFKSREHAMAPIINGFAYFGLYRLIGYTSFMFSDYLRPAIRLAALSELPTGYIFTKDSIAAEETLTDLRLISNLDVIRPADAEETVGAYVSMITRQNGPTALALTTQNVSVLPTSRVTRRAGVLRGAYVVRQEENNNLQLILMASGSEVHIALDTAEELGSGVRVVSVPSMEIFDRQQRAYREDILPSGCRKRIAIEAGISDLWYKYLGLKGKVINVSDTVMKNNLVAIARGVLMTNEKH